MGNDISSSDEEKNNTLNSSSENKNNNKNKSENSLNQTFSKISDNKSQNSTSVHCYDNSTIPIPYVFKWKKEAKKVFICGNFNNDSEKLFEMKKNSNGIFEFKIDLKKNVYFFRFYVEGNFTISNYYPSMKKKGNYFNYIDLTYYNLKNSNKKINKNSKENNNKEFSKNSTNNNNKQTEKSKNNSNNNSKEELLSKNNRKFSLEKIINDYNCFIPKKNEMNLDAYKIPHYYMFIYNIDYNTRQDLISNVKYLPYKEKHLLSENNSYKLILKCPNVNLNHLCSSIYISKSNYIRTCISQRFKQKMVTIVYYRKKENM
jgi:hypothetical protein